MKKHLFDDTLHCKAMYYLEYDSTEVGRDRFLRDMLDDPGYMLYIGTGFVKLTIAVIGLTCEQDAVSAMEQWCNETGREDEIGQGRDVSDEDFGNYELIIERIPTPAIIMPAWPEDCSGCPLAPQTRGEK